MSKYQYKRTTKNSLEGELLIEIRKYQVKEISRELVIQNIISNEYLDNLIKIKSLKNNVNIIYNDENRIELLENLLQKECTKGTARLINEIYEKKK
jgi:hypothetical protein